MKRVCTSAKSVLSLKRTYITTAMRNSCHNSFLAYGSPELWHTGKRFFPMVQGLNHEFQAIKQPGKKPFSLTAEPSSEVVCLFSSVHAAHPIHCSPTLASATMRIVSNRGLRHACQKSKAHSSAHLDSSPGHACGSITTEQFMIRQRSLNQARVGGS